MLFISQEKQSLRAVGQACAVCVRCGRPATKNQRLTDANQQVVIGASDSYEARCRHCYEAPA